VRPSSEGKGIGRQLVLAFCQALAARGVESVCLTTDRDRNDRVNRFYQQLGFRLSRSYVTPEGRAMNEYVRPLA
jgi:predicted N-acetyltransferase YhbS